MTKIEEQYLRCISEQNELIEEGSFINSLLAAAVLAGNVAFSHPKITKDNVDVSNEVGITEKQQSKAYSYVKLSEPELELSKFIYSQVKDLKDEDRKTIDSTVNCIVRTLATRYVRYKERRQHKRVLA